MLILREISSNYSNAGYLNELLRQTIYESSQWDIHPPIRNIIAKKEFLADLAYEFQTTSISEADLSKNEKLISGLIYRKSWMDVGLNVVKIWTDSTNKLIKIISQEIDKKN